MNNMSAVVQQLKKERQHTQKQLQRIDDALAALGSSLNGTRKLSAAGRRALLRNIEAHGFQTLDGRSAFVVSERLSGLHCCA
jgi:Skp family chaperone for outer membrane proteins